MEAIDYLKESNRMCESFENCHECPLNMASRKYEETCRFMTKTHPAEVVEVIEQWSKEHPIITNAQKFKEVFGFCGNTVNRVKPEKGIAGTKGSCGYYECRESCGARHFPRCPMWWGDEYKEPGHED